MLIIRAMTPGNPREPRAPRTGSVAIVGRPNVGKSTLLNALLGERLAITSHHPQTTRDRVLGVRTDRDAQFVFVDTPGVHQARTRLGARMNQEARDAAQGADVIVFVTDLTPKRDAELREADKTILAGLPAGVPVILVLNKVDKLSDKAALLDVLAGHARGFAFEAIVPVSALKKDGLDRILKEVRDRLPRGEKAYDDDALTDRPARFFVREYVREQILRRTREEVPHGVAVVVDRFDETGKLPKIELSVHVDREAHKKIIVGKGGVLLKEIGSGARRHIESLLGKQVFLKIWVRVTPGWYESAGLLRDMGYGGDDG